MRAGNGVSVMSGYRDRSNYDPYASPRYGRPLRPYNWVQWTGVGLVLVGLALDALYFANRFGWSKLAFVTPTLALPVIFLGISLVNSRRQEVYDPAPDLAAARRKWLLIVTLTCVVIIGIATIIAIWTGK